MEAENSSNKAESKMSGYLEKKGKMKVMGSYKKYWFVLECHLLLYYRSKDEYEAISPCKGSVTLGPPCTVKPCTSHCGVFQISTRSTTITLRAENMEDQNKWMQAIMVALTQNCSLPQKMSHFRYSLDQLTTPDPVQKIPLTRQNTAPERASSPKKNRKIIERLQKLGAQTYGGSMGQLPKLVKKSSKNNGRSMSEESLAKVIDAEEKCYSVDSVNRSNDTLDHFYERISSSESLVVHREKNSSSCINKTNQGTMLFGNDSYCDLDRITIVRRSREYENAEINDKNAVDINENIDSDYKASQSSTSTRHLENAYSVSAICGSAVSLDKNKENEYEDVEKYKDMRVYSSTNSDSSNNIDNGKSCSFKNFTRKLRDRDTTKNQDQKNEKVKKSASFLRRVWKRTKKKSKESKTSSEDESIYEVVPEPKVNSKKNSFFHKENQNKIKNEVLERITRNENNHNENATKNIHPHDDFVSNNLEIREAVVNEIKSEENHYDLECPQLPPKKQKSHHPSPFHDIPSNNQPIAPPKKKKQTSIDEILDDLDRQSNEQKTVDSQPQETNKVKQLIKKFSEGESSLEPDVTIRNKRLSAPQKYDEIDSNELTRLLDELSKVTNAPIMTPGVTTSLISPVLSDNELAKFLPVRQRRYSEPDYDIPRPHRSLVNVPKKDENALEATRFFGPILKPSDMHIKVDSPSENTDQSSIWLSMTPDSLEVDISPKTVDSHEEKVRSYNSHEYSMETVSHGSDGKSKSSHKNIYENVVNSQAIIYAQPKHLLGIASKLESEQHMFYNRNTKNIEMIQDDSESVYVDSLEICFPDLKSTVF